MKRYKLLKDLPTFKAGDEFFIGESGNLIAGTPEKPKTVRVGEIEPIEINLMAYAKETLEQFPNILTDWFKEIKEQEQFFTIDVLKAKVVGIMKLISLESGFQKIRELGLLFDTKEDAEAHFEYLKAKAIIKQDTKGFKPDWKNPSQKKIFGYYNIVDKKLCHFNAGENIESKLYFKTEEDIEESFEKYSKEWRTYLTYGQ